MRIERRKKKPLLAERPENCSDCGRASARLESGRCMSCRLRLNAREKAATAPPPPPEPPPEPKQVSISAPDGCFKCGTPGGRLCGGCDAELHGIPRRGDDPKIVYPRPCNPLTGW